MRDFILKNRHRRVEDVALEISRRPDLDAPFILRQIEGWQRMRTKVPHWTEVEDIHFPPRLALEQCSGQPAAAYKAAVIRRLLKETPILQPEPLGIAANIKNNTPISMVDLTGGMGVDFSFIAPLFDYATYIEQRPELVEEARHNFPLLGLTKAEILEGNGIEYIQNLPVLSKKTLVFLDPARRDAHGGKTVLIEDCEPNVAELLPALLEKCDWLVVKLSPMLDIHRAMTTLQNIMPGCIREIHVFAADGECKDLLLVISSHLQTEEPRIFCAEEEKQYCFTFNEEAAAHCPSCETVTGYLYEPGASLLKAGAFKSVGQHFGLQKLHPNSHLYTSAQYIAEFPGRCFHIDKVYSFAKNDLKALTTDLKTEGGKANLAIRNFPSTVSDLRKKLKIKEGGTTYLFATTLHDGKKIIISCRK